MKIVVRAGGVGTRLWPYSRKGRPKQFHAMVGVQSMLQEAVDRIRPLADPEDLYVSTGRDLVPLVHEQLPNLPEACVIVEPALRNTGPAVGLECVLLEARYPGCTIASLGSDHHIARSEEFCRLLRVAEAALEDMPDTLFTIGVKPTRVETGYGHIRKGDVLRRVDGEPVYAVEAFTEKPDEARARAYTESGQYLWNSNMFVWKARTVLDLFARFEPEIYEAAQIDGANEWQVFWQVTLPLLRPIIFFLTIIATIGLLNMFNQPYMLTRGGPRGGTETLMLRLYDIGFTQQRYGDASAFGFLIGLLVVTISLIQIRIQRRWIG